jgi:hypothetical protein
MMISPPSLLTCLQPLQDELLDHALSLRDFGPGLGCPTVDTLKGSKHTTMKELRFGWAGEVWRVAFNQLVGPEAKDRVVVDQQNMHVVHVADVKQGMRWFDGIGG